MVTTAPNRAPSAAAARPPLKMPPPLRPGDRVALFSPGAHGGKFPPEWPRRAREILQGWGLDPLPLPGRPSRHLYLAGPDRERAEAFRSLYCDPEVKALFALRGGYGAARMLPLLDAAEIAAAPPKLVVGMSDVSALLAYLHGVAGLGAVHGPCLAAPGMFDSPSLDENLAALERLLFDNAPPEPYPCGVLHAPGGRPFSARGPLLGGNLAVLAAGLGTPWGLNTRGAVVFFEEVNEAPYRVDRYLTQFEQSGRFEGISALVFGHMTGCDGDGEGLLDAMLRDRFAEAPFPVAVGLPAGHGEPNRALPLGRTAVLEGGGDPSGAGAGLRIL